MSARLRTLVLAALVLGLLFTVGMLLSDGINGLWIARLIARAELHGATAAIAMGRPNTKASASADHHTAMAGI